MFNFEKLAKFVKRLGRWFIKGDVIISVQVRLPKKHRLATGERSTKRVEGRHRAYSGTICTARELTRQLRNERLARLTPTALSILEA